MASETIRVSSATGSIPSAATISGTFAEQSDATNLVYTGSVTSESLFGVNKQGLLKNNLYLYDAVATASGALRRIVNVKGSGTSWTVVIESAFPSTVGATATLSLVTANLSSYTIVNEHASASATVNGLALTAGKSISVAENNNNKGLTRLPVTFVATSSQLLITEIQ